MSSIRTQRLSLLLADGALSSGCSQVSLGEWRVTVLSACVTSNPVTVTTSFRNSLGHARDGWGEKLTGMHGMGQPIHLMIKILLCEVTLW